LLSRQKGSPGWGRGAEGGVNHVDQKAGAEDPRRKRTSTVEQETSHTLKRQNSWTVGARAPVIGFDPGGQFSGGLPEKRAVFAVAASRRRGQLR
jgi:hypothetical protein